MFYKSQNVGNLTPREIVRELDKYVIGQEKAKRAVAIALRNRWRSQQVSEELRDEIVPKNIIMIGPTGVGKTEIARRLAKLSRAPFLKVEASKFTEVGYTGRDVESMVHDLVGVAIDLVREEALAGVEELASKRVEDTLVEILKSHVNLERPPLDAPKDSLKTFVVGADGIATPGKGKPLTDEEMIRQRFRLGEFDDLLIEIDADLVDERRYTALSGGLSKGFMREPGMMPSAFAAINDIFDDMIFSTKDRDASTKNKPQKKVKVREAVDFMKKMEANKLLDKDQIISEALDRAQRVGIIFIDEIDKIAVVRGDAMSSGNDVSRQGVQRDLLPIIEGSSVGTRYGDVKTDHILFIAAGAFHFAKPSDLIPELQGRFPVRVELESLTREHFERILVEPANSLTKQYIELLRTEGISVDFTDEAISKIAEMASQVNATVENIGARRLHTIMELVFDELSFNAPDIESESVSITEEYVNERLEGIIEDQDLSRYIL